MGGGYFELVESLTSDQNKKTECIQTLICVHVCYLFVWPLLFVVQSRHTKPMNVQAGELHGFPFWIPWIPSGEPISTGIHEACLIISPMNGHDIVAY